MKGASSIPLLLILIGYTLLQLGCNRCDRQSPPISAYSQELFIRFLEPHSIPAVEADDHVPDSLAVGDVSITTPGGTSINISTSFDGNGIHLFGPLKVFEQSDPIGTNVVKTYLVHSLGQAPDTLSVTATASSNDCDDVFLIGLDIHLNGMVLSENSNGQSSYFVHTEEVVVSLVQ